MNDNLTVCEENCKFNGYNYTTGKVSCSCNAQINPISKISDIVFDKNKLYESFTDFKNIMNLNVFKCYKLIFKLNNFKHNYANWIMITIIILLIITFFLFYFKEFYFLEKILNLIAYFKSNLNLVKKLIKRKQKEKNK